MATREGEAQKIDNVFTVKATNVIDLARFDSQTTVQDKAPEQEITLPTTP